MPIPDFQAIMLPLLNSLADNRAHTTREVVKALGEHFHLTERDRSELKSSGKQPLFDNRVQWAVFHLKGAGLLDSPRRGIYRITDRGRAVLADGPSSLTASYVATFPEDRKPTKRKSRGSRGRRPALLRDTSSDAIGSDVLQRFDDHVREEAERMAKQYMIFYCLETSIRSQLDEWLSATKGDDWWESGCAPTQIRSDAKRRMQDEIDSGVTPRSLRPLDFTTFGELSAIIENNWDVLHEFLTSRKAVITIMRTLNMLRGPVAHSCPLENDEIDRLRLTVRDWFRQIKGRQSVQSR